MKKVLDQREEKTSGFAVNRNENYSRKKRNLLLLLLLGVGLGGWNTQTQEAKAAGSAAPVKFELPFFKEIEAPQEDETDDRWMITEELRRIFEQAAAQKEKETEDASFDAAEEIRREIEKLLREEFETEESETEDSNGSEDERETGDLELMSETVLLPGEAEAETESEKETESETEAMTESEDVFQPEELAKQLKQLTAQYGEQFLFPMTVVEAEESLVPELKYTMQLRGYDAVLQWKPERTIRTLKKLLERKIAGYDGTWSVYCKNLSTNESFVINDIPMKSASVMKLFILGTVYEAFETGELERTAEIMALVENMIVNSDNADSNELLARLGDGSYAAGIEKVNAFIASHGFTETTHEYNGFEDPATNMGTGHFNQVAAKDCGKLLEDIYRRTWMGRTVSNEMENLLLSQHTRYKIPAGLPDGVLCGNKSGEMDTTENDAAIIYGPNCDYILVVLSSEWNSKDTAISRIAELSRLTYEYMSAE